MDASQQHVPQSSTAPNNASNAPDRSIDLRHVQPLVPLPAWTVADSDAALGAVRWLEDYNNVLARELKGQVFHQRFSQVKIEGLEKLLDLSERWRHQNRAQFQKDKTALQQDLHVVIEAYKSSLYSARARLADAAEENEILKSRAGWVENYEGEIRQMRFALACEQRRRIVAEGKVLKLEGLAKINGEIMVNVQTALSFEERRRKAVEDWFSNLKPVLRNLLATIGALKAALESGKCCCVAAEHESVPSEMESEMSDGESLVESDCDNSELSSEARLTPESEEMYGEESSEASKLSRERKKYTEEEEAEAKRSLLMALFWFMLPILVSLVFGVIPRLLGYRL